MHKTGDQSRRLLFRRITRVYEIQQLQTTAETENGIEGFTSCFAGHEELKSLCQKLQLNSSICSEFLMPYN